jgi:tRNA 5-methylaminomethyl-2-thiouridine biosynthesis bifunctional protein
VHCGQTVDRIEPARAGWRAWAGPRALTSAPVLIVANALAAPQLLGMPPVAAVPGCITRIDPAGVAALRAGLTGAGYLLNAGMENWAGIGATYEVDAGAGLEPGLEPRLEPAAARAGNLARLARLLHTAPEVRPIGAFEAARCVARDRLPLAGALVDAPAAQALAHAAAAQLSDLPRRAGLFASYAFGSRGLTLAVLAAELIAARIEGEPWPVERALADALDPARALLRQLRRPR